MGVSLRLPSKCAGRASRLDARRWGISVSGTRGAGRDLATHGSSVSFPALHCLEHILVDSNGLQHVVLRASNAALQLTINGSSVVDGPVNLTLLVRGFSGLRAAVTHLSTLRRILSPTPALIASPVWTPTTRKLRDAIIAYDGRAAGASYHDRASSPRSDVRQPQLAHGFERAHAAPLQ